ncbi:MAG: glycosyltransferase [Burkholderiales bacterium]
MRILCVFGRYNYGDPKRGEGVEYTHFLPAFRALGHDVEHFESFSRATHADFASLNRALLARVEAWRPKVVFTVLMMGEIWLETIDIIRACGATVINWSTDDSWKYAEFSRLIASSFDAFATTCPDAPAWYARDGFNNCVLSQWAAAAGELAEPLPSAGCTFDVSFVGSCYGTRAARVQRLRDSGVNVECFGHGWPNGPVDAVRLRQIVRTSRVSLNFSEAGRGGGRQIKARVFEVPGAGGMLLTEHAPQLARYFELDREIICFSNDAELHEAVLRLLGDPEERNAIAVAGHRRVVREHTYERRLAELLAKVTAGALHEVVPPDWDAFRALVERHRSGPTLRVLGGVLRGICALVWGRERGSRAARRILFEASWRLLGRHTYTSAGLPGRLFYRES